MIKEAREEANRRSAEEEANHTGPEDLEVEDEEEPAREAGPYYRIRREERTAQRVPKREIIIEEEVGLNLSAPDLRFTGEGTAKRGRGRPKKTQSQSNQCEF